MLAEDHPIVCEGLAAMLKSVPGHQLVGEAATCRETERLVEELKPDLLVLDLFLHGAGGTAFVEHLSEQFPSLRILVLSVHEEVVYAERALAAGARGYVMKSCAREEILGALATIAAGEIYLSEELRHLQALRPATLSSERPKTGVANLSPRELHIFHLLGERRTTGEIALTLGISAKTVETYYERLKIKLDQHHLRDLCHFAEEWQRTIN